MISEQIPAALAGERLDRIVALIAECSRSEAVVLLEAEGVTVDGVVEVRGKLRIEEGQTVEVDPDRLPVAELPQPDQSVRFTVVCAFAPIASFLAIGCGIAWKDVTVNVTGREMPLSVRMPSILLG